MPTTAAVVPIAITFATDTPPPGVLLVLCQVTTGHTLWVEWVGWLAVVLTLPLGLGALWWVAPGHILREAE